MQASNSLSSFGVPTGALPAKPRQIRVFQSVIKETFAVDTRKSCYRPLKSHSFCSVEERENHRRGARAPPGRIFSHPQIGISVWSVAMEPTPWNAAVRPSQMSTPAEMHSSPSTFSFSSGNASSAPPTGTPYYLVLSPPRPPGEVSEVLRDPHLDLPQEVQGRGEDSPTAAARSGLLFFLAYS